ncbi:MAG: lytic transglycosylase domain-containing protein [Magnetococcales bacterium]|nr:lytic transglycosylase domain-containing protein [Magnetococcales bacterium]NGZ26328.1 lytic transglycosylase domain-containing protein [Magnetococcales bacterium]
MGATGGGMPFVEMLNSAMQRSSQVPDGQPLPSQTVNMLAQAMMAALLQTGSFGGGGLSMPSMGYRLQSLPGFQPQGVGSQPTNPPPPDISPLPTNGEQRYEAIIRQAARRYGVDESLIKAVIQTESSFNPQAVSHAGAEGLMQLMPATAAELGVQDSFNPEQNIMGGTQYLSRLLSRYQGNTRLALSAYNWGMGNVERNPEKMPTETRNYVSRIMGMLEGGSAA